MRAPVTHEVVITGPAAARYRAAKLAGARARMLGKKLIPIRHDMTVTGDTYVYLVTYLEE